MALTQVQIDLLNNFYKSQPALNAIGVPSAFSGIPLGDVIHALELAVAANPPEVSDVAYGAGWNGDITYAPSKNAIYDKVEAVIGTIPTVSNAAYAGSWSGDTTTAPSKNAVYNEIQTVIGTIPTLPTMSSGLTNASGEISVAGMTGTGKIVVTPIADLGNDLVFSHVICGSGKITVYVKDASAVSPIAAAAAGAGFAFAYVVVALA